MIIISLFSSFHWEMMMISFCQTFSACVFSLCDWIGLRENLQETIDFPIKYGAFL